MCSHQQKKNTAAEMNFSCLLNTKKKCFSIRTTTTTTENSDERKRKKLLYFFYKNEKHFAFYLKKNTKYKIHVNNHTNQTKFNCKKKQTISVV